MKSYITLTKKQPMTARGKINHQLFPGMKKKQCKPSEDFRHLCRFEELEKREMLAADPISVGFVYVEQGAATETSGDRFYVAWVGGENDADARSALTQITINLDKDGTSNTVGEAYFNIGSFGTFGGSAFKVITGLTSEHIQVTGIYVEDGGQLLVINLENFYAGDTFVFSIDVDEFPSDTSGNSTNSALVEGAEFGGSIINSINGSWTQAVFNSPHYKELKWDGMFLDHFDDPKEGTVRNPLTNSVYGAVRYPELAAVYTDVTTFPYDVTFDGNGISSAGVYGQAGLIPLPIIISGYVYADYNRDCYYDREPGDNDYPLAGVEITLYAGSDKIGSVFTDINGYYEFSSYTLAGLELEAGSYRIVSAQNIVQEGLTYYDYCASGGNFGEKVTPIEIEVTGTRGGDIASENNFAKVLPGSIQGYVFQDYNNANNKELNEPGIEGVTVTLWKLLEGTYIQVGQTTTDAEGFYQFDINGVWVSDPRPGQEGKKIRLNINETYMVIEGEIPAEFSDGKDYIGSLGGNNAVKNSFSDVYVGFNEQGVQYNFGELKLGSLDGYVFEDRNNDGFMKDTARYGVEKGIAHVLITLYQNDGNGNYSVIATTWTDVNGYYRFDNLNIIFDYAIEETQPTDYTDGKLQPGTIPANISPNRFSEITISWDAHGKNFNFGELKLGSIAGNVYEDRNDDGYKANTSTYGPEAGIAGVTIYLYYWDNDQYVFAYRSTQTDANGAYTFDNLEINHLYAVSEQQPAGYVNGKHRAGSLGGNDSQTDYISDIEVTWDDHGVEYNFGELQLGSLSGVVYEDRNDNGIQEEGEKGIANVLVELFVRNTNGVYEKYAQTQTDENGVYTFDNLPIAKTYAIKETQPNGYKDGKDAVGTLGGTLVASDHISDISVKWDQHGTKYTFGEIKPASLSGFVYEDRNNNGIKESGEAGIPNTVVELYLLNDNGTYGKYAQTTTDSNGAYTFDNLPINKKYAIKEKQPTGYVDGKDAVGSLGGTIESSDYITAIPANWDDRGINYNFGELKMGALSGFVYVDSNNNGIKDPNEKGIANVKIELLILNENGTYQKYAETTTDSTGAYYFNHLPIEKQYAILETQPTDYDDGKDAIGSLGGVIQQSDYMTSIPVNWGDSGINYNFGELEKIPPQPVDPPTHPGSYRELPPVTFPTMNIMGGYTPFNYLFRQPSPSAGTVSYFGGGGLPTSYSWHLSVLNGGYPRSIEAMWSTDVARKYYQNYHQMSQYQNVSWSSATFDQGLWLIRGENGNIAAQYNFGIGEGLPVVGDWTGDGIAKIGIYVDGEWLLDRDGNGLWEQSDLWAKLGSIKDQPVIGDWDGDGKSDIGIFGPQWVTDPLAISIEPGLPADSNVFHTVSRPTNVPAVDHYGMTAEMRVMKPHRTNEEVRLDFIDHVFEYGNEGDRAVTGDWNGDGVSKIGVYRAGKWYLDVNGNGQWDSSDIMAEFGGEKSHPIVGDFNGDGIDEIGTFENGRWSLDTNGDYKPDVFFTFGQEGDLPVVGDFNGNGKAQFGVYRHQASPPAETIPTFNQTVQR